ENLLPRVDYLLIGGAMANTLFRAQGLQTGGSLVEEDKIELAKELLDRAQQKIVLPCDAIVATQAKQNVATVTLPVEKVTAEGKIFDVGPQTVADFAEVISKANTILWNGPVGMFEIADFAKGTQGVA